MNFLKHTVEKNGILSVNLESGDWNTNEWNTNRPTMLTVLDPYHALACLIEWHLEIYEGSYSIKIYNI